MGDSIEIQIGEETYNINKEEVFEAFENTGEPSGRISHYLKIDGVKKGSKDVFANIESTPKKENFNTRKSDEAFNQLGFDVVVSNAHESKTNEQPNNPLGENFRETIKSQIKNKGQIIFYGPPGTGKTYTAQQFAQWWINSGTKGEVKDEQLELTTFHPSFSYEDFIEGLTAKEKNGAVEYEVEPGVFKEICKNAKEAHNSTEDDTSPPYVLIIDEINRGNLSQIFGELMTLLEMDKRLEASNGVQSKLAHSNESFGVPQNLYIIGTMNTADESIALLDAALRRRFRFYAFPPNFEKIEREYDLTDPELIVSEGGTRRDQLISASILALEELNTRIRGINQLGKGKQIGHTHLFGHKNGSTIRDTWRFDILPQLEDYYFGKFDRLKKELFNNSSPGLFHWETEQITDFKTEVLYRSLCDIAGISEPAPLEPPTESKESGGNSDEMVEDAWDAGERTPDTFRTKVENNASPIVRDRLIELWELGDEIGRLDAGNGDNTAQVNMELPSLDTNAGLFIISHRGYLKFQIEYLNGPDFTRKDFEKFNSIFEPLDNYQIEIDESDGDMNINGPEKRLVKDMSEDEFENVKTAIRDIREHIVNEVVDD